MRIEGEYHLHLLAIDDDPVFLDVLSATVDLCSDYSLTTCLSADEARDVLTTSSITFDVILLDISMPGTSGIEFLAEIRRTPRLASIPVIMLTSMADRQYINGAYAAGAVDYITKPFDEVELTSRLRRYVRTKDSDHPALVPAPPGSELFRGNESLPERLEGVISHELMSAYMSTLTRASLQLSAATAFRFDGWQDLISTLKGSDRVALLEDVSGLLSGILSRTDCILTYYGEGVFVAITRQGDPVMRSRLRLDIQNALAKTPLGKSLSISMERAAGTAGCEGPDHLGLIRIVLSKVRATDAESPSVGTIERELSKLPRLF